jgi:hypothetical protein
MGNAEPIKGQAGALVSAKRRQARVDIAVEKVRPFWPLEKPTMAELADKHETSIGSLVDRPGPRTIAQRQHQAAQKRKYRRERQKAGAHA